MPEPTPAARIAHEPNPSTRAEKVQLTLLFVSTMTAMAGATIAPSLPAMARFFADEPRSDLLVRLVLTLPALFTAMGSPLAGILMDRFGRKPLLVAAIALYGLAGTAGGLASSLPMLLMSRALLGLSVGGIVTAATTLVADYYHGAARSVVMGRQAAFMGFGGVIFLTLGGFLADLSWRAPFGVYGLAFLWLPLAIRFLPEPKAVRHPNGAAVANGRIPWRGTGLLYAIGFIGMAVFYMIPVQIPFYLGRLGLASGALAGLSIAGAMLIAALVSTQYGRIRIRLGGYGIFAAFFLSLGVGYGIIAVASSYVWVITGLVVAGLGMGLMMPNLNNWAGDLAPPHLRGRIMGGLGTAIYLGQFFSPILTQPIIQGAGLAWGFAAAGILVLLMAAAFAFAALRRSRRGRRLR